MMSYHEIGMGLRAGHGLAEWLVDLAQRQNDLYLFAPSADRRAGLLVWAEGLAKRPYVKLPSLFIKHE